MFKYFINIVALNQDEYYQIGNKENGRPDYGTAQPGSLVAHVHKVPGNVIGLKNGEDNKYPVQKPQGQKVVLYQKGGANNTQGYLDYRYNGKYQEYPPDFGDVGLEFPRAPKDFQFMCVL